MNETANPAAAGARAQGSGFSRASTRLGSDSYLFRFDAIRPALLIPSSKYENGLGSKRHRPPRRSTATRPEARTRAAGGRAAS